MVVFDCAKVYALVFMEAKVVREEKNKKATRNKSISYVLLGLRRTDEVVCKGSFALTIPTWETRSGIMLQWKTSSLRRMLARTPSWVSVSHRNSRNLRICTLTPRPLKDRQVEPAKPQKLEKKHLSLSNNCVAVII